MAGSNGMGPYGTSWASCQPASSVQRMVTMWSVNTRPKPGFSSMASISAAERGAVLGVRAIVDMAENYLVQGPGMRAAEA